MGGHKLSAGQMSFLLLTNSVKLTTVTTTSENYPLHGLHPFLTHCWIIEAMHLC